MCRLSDEDGRAVDLLLDRSGSRSNGHGNGQGQSALPANMGQRLKRVEGLLGLLDQLSVSEPPQNLVVRTLAKINSGAAPRNAPVVSTTQTPERRPQV